MTDNNRVTAHTTAADTKRSRKRSRWGDAAPSEPVAVVPDKPVTYGVTAEEIRQRTLMLQAHIAEAKRIAASRMPLPLILDDQGRQVDGDGNVVVDDKRDVSTLMANRPMTDIEKDMAEAERRVKEHLAQEKRAAEQQVDDTNRFVDPRMRNGVIERRSRSFKFTTPGTHVRKGQNMRLKQLNREIRSERASVGGCTGMTAEERTGTELRLIALTNSEAARELAVVPDVEWWDALILSGNDYQSGIDAAKLNNLIQHPVPLKSLGERKSVPQLSVMLTDREKKKLRRLKKQEKQKEKQDMIKLGLEAPPEARLTIKNMTRVLSREAIEDPTAVEVKARAQMEKRALTHNLHNESRRLTPQEKAQKRQQKFKEDLSREAHVALFRVDRIDDELNRYKVLVNAEELKLTGCLLLLEDCNVVVVEGGPKGVKKYTRLMTKRMKWQLDDMMPERGDQENHFDDEDDDERVPLQRNHCYLIWHGVAPKRIFSSFRVIVCESENMARRQLADKGAASWWDMCQNYQPDDAIQ